MLLPVTTDDAANIVNVTWILHFYIGTADETSLAPLYAWPIHVADIVCLPYGVYGQV